VDQLVTGPPGARSISIAELRLLGLSHCEESILVISRVTGVLIDLPVCWRADRMLSGYIIGASNVQSPHLILQGGSFKPEALCRSAIPSYSPGGDLQSVEDRLPLGLLKGRAHRNNSAAGRSGQLCSWHIQFVSLREDHAAFNKILELANVSWPVGIDQSFHRGFWHRPDTLLHTTGDARHEKVDQKLNVFAPFPERRNPNWKNSQPVK
jgi:hypothetical protein